MPANAREIAALVPMPRLLEALGFRVSERTRRAPCLMHGGSNPTAFAWTDGGLWKCHSCGAGGDRIALVRAVQQCEFREAMEFLAALAGVEYRPERGLQGFEGPSSVQFGRARAIHERAEQAAWRVRDDVLRLRSYYGDALRRVERLLCRVGQRLPLARSEAEREAVWINLALLAPAATYFLTAHEFLNRANASLLARFALAASSERRALIFGESHADTAKVS